MLGYFERNTFLKYGINKVKLFSSVDYCLFRIKRVDAKWKYVQLQQQDNICNTCNCDRYGGNLLVAICAASLCRKKSTTMEKYSQMKTI